MGRDPLPFMALSPLLWISIHSPRMGRDPTYKRGHTALSYFNPLSPHGERQSWSVPLRRHRRFQSTLPAWGETQGFETDSGARLISIHSPRMGRDEPRGEWNGDTPISIHSPRMGRDAWESWNRPTGRDFNPLLPAWGETAVPQVVNFGVIFQSTLPAWGETYLANRLWRLQKISIHSPRMGRDLCGCSEASKAN